MSKVGLALGSPRLSRTVNQAGGARQTRWVYERLPICSILSYLRAESKRNCGKSLDESKVPFAESSAARRRAAESTKKKPPRPLYHLSHGQRGLDGLKSQNWLSACRGRLPMSPARAERISQISGQSAGGLDRSSRPLRNTWLALWFRAIVAAGAVNLHDPNAGCHSPVGQASLLK